MPAKRGEVKHVELFVLLPSAYHLECDQPLEWMFNYRPSWWWKRSRDRERSREERWNSKRWATPQCCPITWLRLEWIVHEKPHKSHNLYGSRTSDCRVEPCKINCLVAISISLASLLFLFRFPVYSLSLILIAFFACEYFLIENETFTEMFA